MQPYDVIVIGGGAAGLMAAGRAAERGRRVLLIEKNQTLGQKLRITGGGRCNATNAEFDPRAFLNHFGAGAKFLYAPFARFGVQETFDFFAAHGLPLRIEDGKRAFPEAQSAEEVVLMFERYLQAGNVDVRLGTTVERLHAEKDRIIAVHTAQGVFSADHIVLAPGGMGYPATGSTGDGFNWLRQLGHTVRPASPALVPLRIAEPWVAALSGTTIGPVDLVFTTPGHKPVARHGDVLFTHFGLSGPLILACSHAVENLLRHGPTTARMDLFPGENDAELDRQLLTHFTAAPNRRLHNVLRQMLPAGSAGLVAAVVPAALLEKPAHAVTQAERRALWNHLRRIEMTVSGTLGLAASLVSAGGLDPAEVDTRTMTSRRITNLHPIGDLLDLPRPTGGYSLQLCWTTGWVAGDNT